MQHINHFIKTNCKNLYIVDDYKFWNLHQKNKKAGKPVFGDQEMEQYFFDDNHCINILNDTNVKTYKVNTLLAMTDPHYFENLLKS